MHNAEDEGDAISDFVKRSLNLDDGKLILEVCTYYVHSDWLILWYALI
jgi:hypothetical protein